ncbi:MAG: hypothetical protein ISR56_05920 [Bacteroidales bacterium]|nr:hypothetical protein [Bacteroidales bacterium]
MFFITSCGDDTAEPTNPSGKLSLEFHHKLNGQYIIFDSLMYINEAGNHYLVNEIQYFISDVTIHKNDGSAMLLDAWEDIHYVDSDIGETSAYSLADDIGIGDYGKLSFTFGINEVKNQTLMFVNPPKSYMFWPELLGGGYHYLKLNGKWINNLEQVSPYNFHLGIGQIYYHFPDSITGYVQNYFTVEMPEMLIEIKENETTTLQIVMNVENWFKSPNVYDHNQWGGDIMQKQDAMRLAVENGHNVFSYNTK